MQQGSCSVGKQELEHTLSNGPVGVCGTKYFERTERFALFALVASCSAAMHTPMQWRRERAHSWGK